MSSEAQGSSATDLKSGSEKIKRPLNAFIIWSKKRRRVIANENPQMHNFDISRKLGLEWQKLSEQEKSYYFDEAKRLKEEHKVMYPNYKYQPRKRDKTNKRGKMFQGAPFHFNFFAPGTSYYDSRYPFGIPESRLSGGYSPEGSHLHGTESASDDLPPSTSPSPLTSQTKPVSQLQEVGSKSTAICPSFRQSSEGFVSYRPCDQSYMHLRQGMEWPHWYPGSSPRLGTVPYYSCLYPWHSRPEYHHS
jgi:hypothetical protein